jgi:type II secretory pathway component PulM
MPRERATSAEWSAYYERAARIRSLTGDPLKRHIRRITIRERTILIASVLFMLMAVVAFGLLTLH